MKKSKVLLLSVTFYIIGALITFALWKFWFWIFESTTWQTIFVVVTLLGAMKYFWGHTGWTIDQLKQTKKG